MEAIQQSCYRFDDDSIEEFFTKKISGGRLSVKVSHGIDERKLFVDAHLNEGYEFFQDEIVDTLFVGLLINTKKDDIIMIHDGVVR